MKPILIEYPKEANNLVLSAMKGNYVYPNSGKRTGGYSSGSYDTNPYILLNYLPYVIFIAQYLPLGIPKDSADVVLSITILIISCGALPF